MISTVIFDLGNVFAFHDNTKLFARMAQAFGSTPEAMKTRLDSGLWARVNTGQLPGDALRRELVARLGAHVSVAEWLEVWNCHFTIHAEQVALTERLVGRVKLVLLSNTHDQHFAYLRPRLPILERFDACILSNEVGHVKPAPAIYEAALRAVTCRPEDAVFFDDVPAFAEAASALGLQGRVYTTAERCAQQLVELGVELPA